ncbi:MAG: hypothetical protein Q7N50_02665, partial [Armatimonadota bacterium]|nr:hypothetical protein [Armatimonadota bacterium]
MITESRTLNLKHKTGFCFKEGVFKKPVDGTTRHFERSEKSAFKHDSESPKSRFLVVPPRNDGF